ncbi:MAG: ATP-dependent DNA helicase [Actinomycetes bacterium]
MVIKYSATELFSQLIEFEKERSGDSKIFLPTAEQIAIIESDPATPSVIIAGAGSGKTETIGARVLWLVANGFVSPNEILGLTFTRKAASELSLRIRRRLRLLHQSGLLPSNADGSHPDLSASVSTYHSYAGRVLSEHAIRMGIDADSDPVSESTAWQIAHSIVSNFDNLTYDIDHSLNTVISSVQKLSGQLGEHDQSIERLRAYLDDRFSEYETMTIGGNPEVRRAIATLQERISILPMVAALDDANFRNGTLSFNDQMSLAAKLVAQFSEIGAIERSRFKVVLLDEYQDTSYSQVRFLSHLFGSGHPVTAVGDPNQAIYGWRSASPETLGTFAANFPAAEGQSVATYKLLTTWRNDQQILSVANRIIDEIGERHQLSFSVDRLRLRPGAGTGLVKSALLETMSEEAKYIAEEFYDAWHDPVRIAQPEKDRSTFAVLARTRSQFESIEEALRDRGLPVEVVGIAGLIHLPEIADIIALLRVAIFPDAGSSMVRLLTGPLLNLGAKDLAALGSFAAGLGREAGKNRTNKVEEILLTAQSSTMENEDFPLGSIIDAMEVIHTAQVVEFTTEGLGRLKNFAAQLQYFRRSLGGSIIDAISEAEDFLNLGVEVLVRDGWKSGRRHLDKFIDEAAKFARTGGSLAAFLRWLEVADSEEGGLKPISIDINHAAIQILTIHQAKGLEWDHVAVPGLAKANFPSSGKTSDNWTKNVGSLPVALRGDRDQLVDFTFPSSSEGVKAAKIKKALDEYDDQWNALRNLEELRLAYVAFTRAKKHLIVTTSWFRTGDKPVDPSTLYQWVVEEELLLNPDRESTPLEKPDGTNPARENPKSGAWPRVNSRREAILQSAELVSSAQPLDLDQIDFGSLDDIHRSLAEDAQAIIAEATRRRDPAKVYLPSRLSVSSLIQLKEDPLEFAVNIRRPMPNHIDKYARRGTAFHAWVERKFVSPVLIEDEFLDPHPIPMFDEIPLNELQAQWLASDWADRTPVAVEVPFETMLDGILLRGRIDAVYQAGENYEIVDWKTGREKEGEDLASAAIQLAMYRLAFSKLFAIPLQNISAAFHYVGANKTVHPADIFNEDQLKAILSQI